MCSLQSFDKTHNMVYLPQLFGALNKFGSAKLDSTIWVVRTHGRRMNYLKAGMLSAVPRSTPFQLVILTFSISEGSIMQSSSYTINDVSWHSPQWCVENPECLVTVQSVASHCRLGAITTQWRPHPVHTELKFIPVCSFPSGGISIEQRWDAIYYSAALNMDALAMCERAGMLYCDLNVCHYTFPGAPQSILEFSAGTYLHQYHRDVRIQVQLPISRHLICRPFAFAGRLFCWA